ncbi:RING-H2 finger protein ATL48 [Prunus persica]|uniref:RING-H2 finger protein ATL48 n=1 Tax=Prunus persica TaxID=3760 RepID=UPI0009AB57C0|nr:RING-H2 finger protein ATL48 [Prunus persica]
MEKVEPTLEVFYEEKKRVKNPWGPDLQKCAKLNAIEMLTNRINFSGALLTAGVLTAGLISFRQGNSQLGQKLMRARVVAQGGTVALMVGSAYYYGENPWKKSS